MDAEAVEAAMGLLTLHESKEHAEVAAALDELLLDSKTTVEPLAEVLPRNLAELANSYLNDTQEMVSFIKEGFVRLRIVHGKGKFCGWVEELKMPNAKPVLPEEQLPCQCGVDRVTEFCATHAWTPEIRDQMKAAEWSQVPDTDFCSESPVVEVPGKPDTLRLEKHPGSRFACDFRVSHALSVVLDAAGAFRFPRSHATRLYALLEAARTK